MVRSRIFFLKIFGIFYRSGPIYLSALGKDAPLMRLARTKEDISDAVMEPIVKSNIEQTCHSGRGDEFPVLNDLRSFTEKKFYYSS